MNNDPAGKERKNNNIDNKRQIDNEVDPSSLSLSRNGQYKMHV
jgi:hypothetical protein